MEFPIIDEVIDVRKATLYRKPGILSYDEYETRYDVSSPRTVGKASAIPLPELSDEAMEELSTQDRTGREPSEKTKAQVMARIAELYRVRHGG